MSSEPDASSHILHAARLLLGRAPTTDAADGVVEKWGRYVVELLDGLKAKQPEFLSLPEVISVIDLLQDIVDARRDVSWLVWGGDWLPGTVIEQCLSRLPAAVNDSTLPPPPPTKTVKLLPQVTIVKAAVPVPASVAALNLGSEEELDATCRVKRTAPEKSSPSKSSSSCEPPTKRARYTPSVSLPKSIKGKSLVAQLDLNSLREPRKVLHECDSCESRKKLCLTVTKKGVILDRCAQCIIDHKKCEWKQGHLEENQAYHEESSSFYDPVGTAKLSKVTVPASRSAPATTSVPATKSVHAPTTAPVHTNIPDHEPITSPIRLPCGPKSAIKRQVSGLHTHASLPLPPSGTLTLPPSGTLTLPTPALSNSPVAPTPLSIPFPPANDTVILESEMTAGAGDSPPANDDETLEAIVGWNPRIAELLRSSYQASCERRQRLYVNEGPGEGSM
ncbi:hypothetical protein K503DRAFT_869048 [Rhizopogon vinicolor AM-OR11-026]|uniref:Uncharacterized protein n=1 Tax=Rhizopogon vinicolor AM-OR11-026 TaxID=1314800 RepID=A0A1B7MNR2_9AGAM|nr:hypothetical protein K503DRAFT_869048 [Rhizopogon vinicolor AM-OR11-026]